MSTQTERSVEQLMKLAGEREMPTPAAMERARLAAESSWQELLRQAPTRAPRRWLKPTLWLATAAAVSIALLLFLPPTHLPAPVAARVVSLEGDVSSDEGGFGTAVLPESAVIAGTTLETAGGRVAFALAGALSLRMNQHTQLRFDSPSSVTLLAGDIYVDSGGVSAAGLLRIATAAGEVRHVGTQFRVFVSGDDTRVRVREGRVLFTPLAAGAPLAVVAGDELRAADGRIEFKRGLPSSGTEWEWAAALAPPFDIESRPLVEFITWAAREHGWQIRYASATVQQQAYEIRLHGELDSSNTAAMLERMSMITGVPLAVRDGVLSVGAVQ